MSGATEQDRAGSEEARAALERGLRANPGDPIARHNLAVELRRLDRPVEALAEVERALARGARAPETAMLRAHLLGDLGRFDEAVEQYRQVLDAHPEMVGAHETLAKLLPQIGRGEEALESFRTALARAPGAGLLRVSALATAQALGAYDQLLAWAREAEAIFGADTMVSVYEATALSALGEGAAARDLLIEAIRREPDYAPAHGALAYILLKLGDPGGAAAAAAQAVRRVPDDQAGWALLGTAWRLLGDERQHWLLDYDRLVMTIYLPDIDLPRLAEVLTGLHLAGFQPAEQSLRGGTQTRDNLFDKKDPAIRALAASICRAVVARLAGLPRDEAHPFLRRNTGSIAFAGSWSVRLRDQGFHINHIHPSGWLSSACYIALPPETEGSRDAGALTFGVPDTALGLDLPPARVVVPWPGRLIIFPSFFWHGTLPFASETPRLTVAFDALPVDRGARRR
jgi:tetratricopeptide (TPR) repeat protein